MRYTVEPGRWIARDGIPIFAIMLNSDRAKWESFGPADADKMAHTIAAVLNNPHTIPGDKPPSPEFLNALAVYRSPDDVEMTMADQFRVIADRIAEDTEPHRNTPEQEIADSRAKRIAGGGPRYIVDGHETADEDSPFMGDGKFPPFVIFDIDRQRNLTGNFQTREAAEYVADELNRKEREHSILLKHLCPEPESLVSIVLSREFLTLRSMCKPGSDVADVLDAAIAAAEREAIR